MQGYEKYKESGVAWIGRIPEGWEIRRIATIGNFFKGKGIPKSFLSDSGFPAIVYGEIYTKYDISTSKTINFIPEESSEDLTYIEKGDLLFTGSGETREDIGKCIVYMGSNKVYIGGDIIVLRQEKINSLFLSYVLNSHISIYQRARMAKGEIVVHIYQSNLKEILFCLPSAIEQDHIANFLDKKTSEIDVLISQKEQLLVLYEEEKAAIINQAVTKGIDPNVKMKESGVPWLGKIPEHWTLASLKWISKIYSGGTPDRNNDDYWFNGDIPWLNSGTVNQSFITTPSEYITEEGLTNSSAKWINKNSLVMALAGQGKTKGMVALVTFPSTCNQSLGVIKPYSTISSKFLLYFLKDKYYYIRGLAGEGKRDGLNLEIIGSLFIPVFNKTEQDEIVEFIENALLIIDKKIQKTKKIIALQKEYRTALISEVVTGKVKVPEEDI